MTAAPVRSDRAGKVTGCERPLAAFRERKYNMHIGLGLGLVLLGGLLQGSFALPMKRMPAWRWENTWLVYSVAGMIVVPWALVWATVPHASKVLGQTSETSLIE